MRVVKRLRTDERKKSDAEAAQKLGEFKNKRQTVHDAWSAQPDLGEPARLTAPTPPHRGLGHDARNEP